MQSNPLLTVGDRVKVSRPQGSFIGEVVRAQITANGVQYLVHGDVANTFRQPQDLKLIERGTLQSIALLLQRLVNESK